MASERFDMVIDLRNSFFGAFLPAAYRLSPWSHTPGKITHRSQRHAYCLRFLRGPQKTIVDALTNIEAKRDFFVLSQKERDQLELLLRKRGLAAQEAFVVIAPGARSHIKRWSQDNFKQLAASLLRDYQIKIVLVGDVADTPITAAIAQSFPGKVIDMAGTTSLNQLAGLLEQAQLVITNDSATLHIASYLQKPIIALFGPTNENKYGPWSGRSVVVKKEIFCRPCEKAQCRFNTLACMQLITVGDVLRQVKVMLHHKTNLPVISSAQMFKRILVVRTDRIGDVLLSTPVLDALRAAYPNAYIAMLVSSQTKDVVCGNPFLDEVIVYDKECLQKGWIASMKFSLALRKKRFDVALVLHPTNRAHLVVWGAAIPRRIGYDRKLGFLLTDRLLHRKQEGAKHELEYNFDILQQLGIAYAGQKPFMPLQQSSELWADALFSNANINIHKPIIALHPAASDLYKTWPSERFAETADTLVKTCGATIIVVSGPKKVDLDLARQTIERMRHSVIDVSGKTSVSQLASLLKRCHLLISNDSGPVHIATAVGTPVISIFGRGQRGLSPKRWGPVGEKDVFVHADVGCVECLAHNCKKSFACFQSIPASKVIALAHQALQA